MRTEVRVRRWQSPVGELLLGACNGRLCVCDWTASRRHQCDMRRVARALNADFVEGDSDVARMAVEQLEEYFEGRRREFSVPLLFTGTEFQNAVWAELQRIPYGETITYGQQAHRMGRSRAVRAVATANAANPVSIFVPCHRVVGASGLTGYAGGLDAKRYLLELELSLR